MNKIRVGLLVDDMMLSAWGERMLRLVLRDEQVEIALLVRNAAPRDPPRQGWFGRRSRQLHAFWRKFDGRLFRLRPDAFAAVDGSALLADVPSLDIRANSASGHDEFLPSDIDRIKAFGIDVLIKLGFGALRGDILRAASCGVWACAHADRHGGRFPENGAREVLSGQAVIQSALVILSGDVQGHLVLQRSWSSTDPISVGRCVNAMYWKTASFVPRKLRELGQLGRDAFIARHETSNERLVQGDAVPDNGTVFARLPVLFAKKLHAKLRGRFFRQQWMLLYHSETCSGSADDISNYRQLLPPEDRFWADPFVVEHEGRYAIFIEELEYADDTGYLSVIHFDEDGNPVLPPVPVLKQPYHLSYPQVFEDGGNLYMVPESSRNRTIQLYRAARFPDKWEFVMNLMEDVSAVDTTIWKHDGKYWMFANVTENAGASSCDELHLFFSDSLMSGGWQPHPCNPVVSDVRRARPAGRIFEQDGRWYRPSQDCSGSYGRAIEINRIEHVDETSYRETRLRRIDADWDKDIVCTHTFSRAGRLTCIDGLKIRRKTSLAWQSASRRLSAWLGEEKRSRMNSSAGNRAG